MARTAKDFSRKQIWGVATKYAFTEKEYSHEYFERDLGISTGTFYTLLKKAVIENIVDDEIVDMMKGKAKYNASLHAGEKGAKRSENHYEFLKKKRAIYMLPKDEAIKITMKYCETVRSKKEFARENCITIKLLNRTILKSIVESWVSDEIVMRIKKRSLRRNPDALEFWEKVEKLRENNKNQG